MHLRRGRRQAGELPVDGHEPADEQALPPPAAADAVLLQRALARLPANTRGVLWLYHAEGYTHEEIAALRSEEHTSELQSLMRISYAVFCLKKKNKTTHNRKQTKIQK